MLARTSGVGWSRRLAKLRPEAWARRMTLLRRTAAVLAVLPLAGGALLATAPGSASGAPRSVTGDPQATDQQVETALGVGSIRAAIVFIVDVTQSMSNRHNGLYGEVYQEVPAFIRELAVSDPGDEVAIVLLGKESDTQLLYNLRSPSLPVWLPPSPYSDESDFGYAFKDAVDVLSQAAPTFKVGQVLLFSDGDVTEPASDDPAFAATNSDFSGAGWREQAARAAQLRARQAMTIVGYVVPLSPTPVFSAQQRNALRQVFPAVQDLPSGASFAATLDGVKSQIVDSKVMNAATPDDRAGVQVTWGSLPAKLDFRKAGNVDVTVTLTARTKRIPLYLSGLSVASTGLPATLRATLPDQALMPGTPVPVHVRLSWGGGSSGSTFTGGTQTVHGSLMLAGSVSSPFSYALTTDFGDSHYSPGGLRGSASPQLAAIESTGSYLPTLTFSVILALLVLAAAGFGIVLMTSMRGTLLLTSTANVSGSVPLRGRRVVVRTDGVIREAGWVTVQPIISWLRRPGNAHPGSGPRGRGIRVKIRFDDERKRPGDATYRPGEVKMTAGVWMEYKDA